MMTSLILTMAQLVAAAPAPAPVIDCQAKAELHWYLAVSAGTEPDASYEDTIAQCEAEQAQEQTSHNLCSEYFAEWSACDTGASWGSNMVAWCATEAELGDHVCEAIAAGDYNIEG